MWLTGPGGVSAPARGQLAERARLHRIFELPGIFSAAARAPEYNGPASIHRSPSWSERVHLRRPPVPSRGTPATSSVSSRPPAALLTAGLSPHGPGARAADPR